MGYPIQPEEIDAAHARGAAEERAAVVAWLEVQTARLKNPMLDLMAAAIQAGEHLGKAAA